MKIYIIPLLLLISFIAIEMAQINSRMLNEPEGEVDIANFGIFKNLQLYFVF